MDSSTPPTADAPISSPSQDIPTRPKSPPLAFEKTSNDSLAPFNFAPSAFGPAAATGHSDLDGDMSPSAMGSMSPVLDLQIVVDQQMEAIRKLHEAFTAERQSWSLERDRLYKRIGNLEMLLKTGDHHSPAKSPIVSPNITSPASRATINLSRLSSIAEDENTPPLSHRREAAPRTIEIPTLATIVDEPEPRTRQSSVVQFNSGLAPLKIEEIPVSPQASNRSLSPLPPNNRQAAGHTPLMAPRPPTPPPKTHLAEDLDDTPTRHNTHLNNLLTQSNDSDEDLALTGPLNMPELPNNPGADNFTLEALSKRLERVARSPDESKPTIFAQPSPGMMTPLEVSNEESPALIAERSSMGFVEPTGTRDRTSTNLTSASLSPGNAGPISPEEMKIHSEFESGGIKLKKKPSSNFGAPFGQLGGFSGLRKMS